MYPETDFVSVSRKQVLPLPPYGNHIDGESDLVMIYCGARAWELAPPSENRVASLIYPANRDPNSYRWPVRGKSCLVFAMGGSRLSVDLLTIELLRNGASRVFVKYDSSDDLTLYDADNRDVA